MGTMADRAIYFAPLTILTSLNLERSVELSAQYVDVPDE